jgi:segregation and condensation protein A
VNYTVQTPVFEGPFDLLLHLILREQVDIYEISLSVIVDEYLKELDRMRAESDGGLNLEIATEFLLVAATLVELKSRRLLPVPDDLDLDEELALWEERDLLLHRLLECKTFKDAAQMLVAMMADAERSVPRLAGMEEKFLVLTPDPLEGTSLSKLHKAYLRAVMPKVQPHVDLLHVTPVRLTVAETVQQLALDLPHLGRTTFRALTERMTERMEIIVNFLALLELYKQGFVELDQFENFGDMQIFWTGESDEVIDLREHIPLVDLREHVDTYEG